jgi:hypothetical protein
MRNRPGFPFGAAVVLSSLVLGSLAVPRTAPAADYYLHTSGTDTLDQTSPTATTARFKDSPPVNRTTY